MVLLRIGNGRFFMPMLLGDFALDHVLSQQIPTDKACESSVGRLRWFRSEAVAGFGVVVFMHRSPFGDIAMDIGGEGDG